MSTLLRPLAIAALIAVLPGCSAGADGQLAGRTFIATSVTTADMPRNLVPRTTIRVTFGDDGRLGVSGGCNMMGAAYRIDGAILRIADGTVTEMACDDDVMAQDDWVFGFLGAGPSVDLAGDDLTLAAGDTVMELTDREIVEPDLSLTGPTWTVDSVIAGDAVSSVPVEVIATLRFSDDGRVEVATGCNRGGGRYAVEGGTLRFDDLVLTEMACDGPAGAMESAVLAVLQADSVSFAIDGSSLTLGAGASGLVLRSP